MNTFQVTALVNDIEKTFACADDQYILDAAEEGVIDLYTDTSRGRVG